MRQPQQERSRETQKVLLEATIDCICELGYQHASTTEIARRAGVSRGAMLHHYPTKLDLLSAAFQQVHDQVTSEAQQLIAQMEEAGQGWPDILEQIYGRFFQGQLWDVTLELIVAARTDRALWQRLVPTVQRYYADVDQVWHQHFTTRMVDAEVAPLLNLSLCVLRGMAVQTLLREDPAYYTGIMRHWRVLITPLIYSRSH